MIIITIMMMMMIIINDALCYLQELIRE